MMFTSALFVTGILGGFHCLGWHSYFPSYVEHLLWRVSALVVTLFSITITLLPTTLQTIFGKFAVGITFNLLIMKHDA
jgi:hypothetical protein